MALFLTQNSLVWSETSKNHLGWMAPFAFRSDVTLPRCCCRAHRGIFWLTCLLEITSRRPREDLSRRTASVSHLWGRWVWRRTEEAICLGLAPAVKIKVCVLLHSNACCCFVILVGRQGFRCQGSCSLLECFGSIRWPMTSCSTSPFSPSTSTNDSGLCKHDANGSDHLGRELNNKCSLRLLINTWVRWAVFNYNRNLHFKSSCFF